ncbi:alpha/beta hydrolase [Deferrisoma palaeochoriense]
MTLETGVRFPSEGAELEGRLHVPGGEPPVPGVVVCHPHPLHGGSMSVPVVKAVARALAERGISTLRFNFRGVGRSTGAYDEGEGEVDDVVAAAAFLAAQPGVDPGRLGLVGYSFGAWVGGRAAERILPGLRALVAVAPPLERLPLEAWTRIAAPKLVLVGDRDDYCPLDRFEFWYAALPEPKERRILPGADHFLGGREGEVARAAAAFLDRHLKENPG